MINNPFVYTDSVIGDDFFDREVVVNEILRITINSKVQGNVWLVGERQSGKTSLLENIELRFKNNRRQIKLYRTKEQFGVSFIYANCQHCDSENKFYEALAQNLTNRFHIKRKKKNKPYESFLSLLKQIHKNKCYLVFLLDEFDAFIEKLMRRNHIEAENFLSTLNVIKQRLPGMPTNTKVFGCLIAANQEIKELVENIKIGGSGLNYFENLELEWFDKDQVKSLADHYLRSHPLRFSKNQLEFCYKMTKGYPLFTQKLYYLMYDEKIKHPDNAQKDFFKAVKKKYVKEFKKTVEEWQSENKLPRRTFNKIKGLTISLKDELKDIGVDYFSEVTTKLLKE